MIRFSIITVTYNAEKHLKATLQSVAEQTFKNFEHIVWDGGSSDRTLEIVKSYPHIRLFQGQDSGIADAMNQGAYRAKGEFVMHLHADDLFAHQKVLEFIDTALKQHPWALWLYGQIATIDEKGEKIFPAPKFHHFDYQRLKKYNCISHPAVCISRKLFLSQNGFDPNLCYAMDYDLWLRLGKIAFPLAIPAELAIFREHSGSISSSTPIQVAYEANVVRKRYVHSFWEKWRSDRTMRRRLRLYIVD